MAMDIDINGYTHEHMQDALIDMYPELRHGRDYMVAHPIDEKTNLQKDLPFIIRWSTDKVKQPADADVHAYFKAHEERLRAAFTRRVRDEALLGTDGRGTMPADAPPTFAQKNIDAWRVYRQALRDIPEQPGFPFNVVWPERPA
jgi:hypothetical protein